MSAPHTDCPSCPDCTAPCGTTIDAPSGKLHCAACGHDWEPTEADLSQAKRADAAWEAMPDTDEEAARQRKIDAIAAEHARRQTSLDFGEASP